MNDGIPLSVLARYRDLAGRPHRLHGTGLINHTFLVEGLAGRAIVQRLHPVFAGTVNEDIDVVTAHLEKKDLPTPRPIRTDDGALWVEGADGRPFRALTFLEGETFDRVPCPAVAREAVRLVARFHVAVADLDHEYRHVRAGVHDTKKHLRNLADALAEGREHRLFARVEPVATRILAEGERLPELSGLPQRHAHGDLKLSNLLFRDGGERAHCLLDLDTLGRLIWPFELGDALRSWCNPRGEDEAEARLDLDIFRAAVEGYGEVARRAGLCSAAEAEALALGLRTICLELAARFVADALRESYFGFDARRFATRGEHNLVRGLGQLSLFESVLAQEGELCRIATAALLG